MFASESGMELYRFYKDKEAILFENYRHLESPRSKEEHYHDFRVSIKRINAIYRLLELITGDFDSTTYMKPLRSIFKPAGSIREAQVNMHTVAAYKLKKEELNYYGKYINARIESLSGKLREKLKEFDISELKKNRQVVKECCKNIQQKELENRTLIFIRDRINLIRDNIAYSDELVIHQIRITLKEISAIVSLLKKIKVPGFDDDLLDLIKDTEDKLGNWHDKVVLNNSLEKFIKSTKNEFDVISSYRLIREKINKENKAFLDTVEEIVLDTVELVEKPLNERLSNL